MKVIRILKYEGSENWLRDTLGRSLPDEKRSYSNGSITAVTLGVMPDSFDLLVSEQKAEASDVKK